MSSSSRLFSFFSSKLSRQASQISLASTITQDDENNSIMSSSSTLAKNWHYCNCCKIGFASKNRHDWHLEVCRNRSSGSV
ncbi:uncharacterized protein ATC70_013372 [Mucor velutinosus]|uniref:Uncharacterized protein n=1 Tax=Mucor velutinosus TaxID=708070 RepID=A0AAN7D8Z7_9FUNG|nr:hypothetical protein ATC70_013372 [Mucor velutinosus]